MSEAEYTAPKVSVSYSWEDEAHMQWVGEITAGLRGDGVDVSLDQWMVGLGKPLPEFIEQLVRENERVLVICTPTYKEKSDARGHNLPERKNRRLWILLLSRRRRRLRR